MASLSHADLTTLKLFLAVYREGNITRASEKENIAPSAISRRIIALEEQYDVRLFERGQSGVRPTQAAHTLATYVQSLINTIDQIDRNLSDFGKGRKGIVNIHCNSTALRTFVARELRDFEVENPEVAINLRECSSHHVLRGLIEGHCEIGIFNSNVAPHDLSILGTRTTPLMVVMPVGHPLSRLDTVPFQDTLSYPFIALRESPSLSRIIDNAIVDSFVPNFVQLRPSSFGGMREMVRNGFGIALMPEVSCLPYEGADQIVCRRLAEPWAISEMHICVRDEGDLSPAAKRVIEIFCR